MMSVTTAIAAKDTRARYWFRSSF